MERLTYRKNGRVYFDKSKINPKCIEDRSPSFCRNSRDCEFCNDNDRTCPYLMVMDKLAEYEDKAEQVEEMPGNAEQKEQKQ